ncbi:MAG: hypothetical protein ABS862_06985 [Carnobacterium inhibens]
MKKLKINLIIFFKIISLFLAFFIFSPSLQAKASFSDIDNINMGITLELGSISLATEDTNIIDPVCFTEGGPVLIASSKLVNDGSLSGKLAYKIDVTEGNRVLTADELKNTMISIEFETEEIKVEATAANLNTNSFAFIKNASGSDIVVEPNSVGKIPVTVSYESSTPTKEEKITVKVTFRLIQTNASNANANMFLDEITLENSILLVPKVIEEKSYWPDKSTFTNKTSNNKVTYSLEKMEMVFSEVYNPKNYPTKEIKNLNKAVLYIQLPIEEELKTTDYKTGKQIDTFKFYSRTQNATGKVNVESIELDEKNHGYKVTFSLLDSYDSSDPNKVQEYTNKLNYQLHQQFGLEKYTFNGYDDGYYDTYAEIGIDNDNYASRLVLSSDIPNETNAWNYEQKIIPLSAAEKTITIKQLNKNSNWVYKSEFKDVRFTEETLEFEVKEKDSKLVDYSLISKNAFSLKLNPGGNSNEATLNVIITGDTKNTLVISRELELQNYLLKIKSTKIPLTTKEVEQQTNSEEKIEESSSMIDSTLPNNQVIEEPIDEDDQEEVEEVIDSSSADSDAEIKEETVPIENSDQSTSEEKISDEQINE